MIQEKIEQAAAILAELDIDLWLTFVRESATTRDPALDMILGANCTWTSAFLISRNGPATAIVGSLDARNVRDHAEYRIVTYTDSIREPLLAYLEQLDPARIAVNYSLSDATSDGLTHGLYIMLREYLAGSPWIDRLESAETLMAALRGRKSPEERRRIQKAIDITLDIYDGVGEYARPGMSEKDIQSYIRGRLGELALEPAWDRDHCPAVFTGPDSAGAHAGPTDRTIEPGHLMNIDFGVRCDGYVSDLQRTWYVLEPGQTAPPEDAVRGFETIREAIRAAAAALKPGVEGWTIDEIARRFIVEAGYEEFPHGLGHQVGRAAHDGSALLCPRWDRYKRSPYLRTEQGQIYTLEPRLTVKGRGIATVEEIVAITETGCEFLSRPQNELFIIT
ncbi:aminopeptidase P family protein [bacterium]|nr:aminopeptidase P family protein [bacterium]